MKYLRYTLQNYVPIKCTIYLIANGNTIISNIASNMEYRTDDIRIARPGQDHRCGLHAIAEAMNRVGTTQGQVQDIRRVVNSPSNLVTMDSTQNAAKGERTKEFLEGASPGGRRSEIAIDKNIEGIDNMLRNEDMTKHTRKVLNEAKKVFTSGK